MYQNFIYRVLIIEEKQIKSYPFESYVKIKM